MEKTCELMLDLGGSSTRMRFPPETTITEVIASIQEKLGKSETDMGLFRPENVETSRPAMWLPSPKPLRDFQIKAMETIYYKKRNRKLKYQLIDGTQKVVIIDDAATVEQIAHIIGAHIGLKNTDEFGLRYPEDKASWLDPLQTLQQLRIHPDRTLLYARRFFGESLDLADPFQLQLYYIECNKAILDDDLPCNRDEAIRFAALQLQITFGNYDPKKHKIGWLNKTDFLPLHWQKDKKIEENIYKEYKKLAGLPANQAKYRYYNEMRLMQSFGTTFFTCLMFYDDNKKKKPKPKKKTRLIKLGISREKFTVLDLSTREPLHTWDFTWHKNYRVKILPNGESMVLIDFGDHLPSQLLVKSEYSEQIGKLITGYIDLLLKPPQEAGSTGLPDDFIHAQEEIMEPPTAFSTAGVISTITSGYFRGPNNMIYQPPSQRVNVVNITSAQRACSMLSSELGSTKGFTWVNPSELTLENAKIQFNSDRKAFASTVDDLIGTAKLNPTTLKRRDIDIKATQLTAQVKAIAARARSVAAFEETRSLYGAKAVADAIANMFTFLDKSTVKPDALPSQIEFSFTMEQAEKAIHRTQKLLEDSNRTFLVDEGTSLMMVDYIKEIDNSFNQMLEVCGEKDNYLTAEARTELEAAVKQTQVGKEWLLRTLQSIVPVMNDPTIMGIAKDVIADIDLIADHLLETAKKVGIDSKLMTKAREGIKEYAKEILSATKIAEPKCLEGNIDFAHSATMLTCALSDLRTAIQEPNDLMDVSQPDIIPGPEVVMADQLYCFINDEVVKLKKGDLGDFETQMNSLREGVAKQAVAPVALRSDPLSILINSTSSALVNVSMSVEIVAQAVGGTTESRLDKTTINLKEDYHLLETYAEELRDNPTSTVYLSKIANTIGRLEGTTQQLLTDAGEISGQSDLRYNTKQAIAKAKVLSLQVNRFEPYVKDAAVKTSMNKSIKTVQSGFPDVLNALGNASQQPGNENIQNELLNQAQWLTQQLSSQITVASQYAAAVGNDEAKGTLMHTIENLYQVNNNLIKSCNSIAAASGEALIESAIEDIDAIKVDLDTAAFAASQGLLKAVPGQTRDEALEMLQVSTKSLADKLDTLTEYSKEGKPVSVYAPLILQCASDMSIVAKGTRLLATTVIDREQQKVIIGAGQQVHDKAMNVISIARVVASNKDYQKNEKKIKNLESSNIAFKEAVSTLLSSPEAIKTEGVDNSIASIKAAMNKMLQPSGKYIKPADAMNSLVSVAKALSAAVAQYSDIVLKNPLALDSAAKMIGLTTSQLIQSCGDAISVLPDKKADISKAVTILDNEIKIFLTDSKDVAVGKNKQNVEKLKASEERVKAAISEILRSVGAPASQSAEEAISIINVLLAGLNEEEGEDVSSMSPQELYDSFSMAFKVVDGVSNELAKASGSASSFPLGILAKDAIKAVERVIEPARVVSKVAYKWTPLETKLLKEARLIQEDPVNIKEVTALVKSLGTGIDQLNAEATQFISANPNDNRIESIKQSQKHLLSAYQHLQLITKSPERNFVTIAEIAKDVAHKVKNLSVLKKPKPDHSDVLTPQFAENLKEATRTITVAITGQLRAAAAVVIYEDIDATAKELDRSTKIVESSLNDLIQLTGALNPGIVACESAAKIAQKSSEKIDTAIIGLNFDGKFNLGETSENKSLAQYSEDTTKVLKDLADDIQHLIVKARVLDPIGTYQEAEKLMTLLPVLTDLVLHTAAATVDKEEQVNIMETGKNLMDNVVKVLGAIKAINIYDPKSLNKLDQTVSITNETIGELLNNLQSGSQIIADCESAIAALKSHTQKIIPLTTQPKSINKNYYQCRLDLNAASKDLLSQGRRLLLTDKTKGGEVSMILLSTVEATDKFVSAINDTITVMKEDIAKKEIREASEDSIKEIINLVHLTAETIQGQEKSSDINTAFKILNTKIGEVFSAAQRGDIVEQALVKSSKTLADTVQLLNTTAIFAQTGGIEISDPNFPKYTHQQLIEQLEVWANQVAVDTAKVIQAVSGNDEQQYADAISTLSQNTSSLGLSSTWNAAKLPVQITQIELINTTKTLTSTITQLLNSSKDFHDKPDDITKQKIMVALEVNIKDRLSEILTASKSISGPNLQKAEKELDIVKNELIHILSDIPVYDSISPEDLVKASREVMNATAQLRFANTQESIIEAVKKTGAATEKMLKTANTISVKLSPTPEIAQSILDVSKKSVVSMVSLIDTCKGNKQDPAAIAKIEEKSDLVTNAISEVISQLRLLPDTQNIQLSEVEDHEKRAEEELKKCTIQIDKSKQALEETKAKLGEQSETTVADKVSADINKALLTATAAIADATLKLVSTAEAAQSDRCQSTNKRAIKYNTDPTWANGLVSASNQVSSSIQHLVKSATDAVEGKSQESLVQATQEVAQATAHLVQASNAKSNPTVAGKLNTAAKLVANATSKLVEASNKANQVKNQMREDELILKASEESSTQELEQKMRILKLENELEKAKRQLARIRRRN